MSRDSRGIVGKKTRARYIYIYVHGVITGTQLSFLTFGTADESKRFVERFQTGSLRHLCKNFYTDGNWHSILSTTRKIVSFCVSKISVKTLYSGAERERESRCFTRTIPTSVHIRSKAYIREKSAIVCYILKEERTP